MHADRDKQRRFMAAYAGVHEGFMRYCSALSFERVDVEDMVQDVLLGAYDRFDDLRDKARLQHYLIRAARNRSVSAFRSARKKAALTQVQAERMAASGATPEQLADVQLLYRAIHKLPARQRDAILLYEISGYPQREVAVMLSVTVPAVKMLLQRGRAGLKRLLTDPGHPTVTDLIRTAKSITL